MSEQILQSPVSPADVERHQQSDPLQRDTVLQKLHEDSRLSSGQRALVMAPVIASESLTRGPISTALVVTAPAQALSIPLAGLAVFDTTRNAQIAVEAEELKRESALIKEAYGSRLSSEAVGKIEEDCSNSKVRRLLVYGHGAILEGAIGFASGIVLTPFTGGYSLPVLSLGGAGVGYMGAGRELQVRKYGCEVDKMKEQIRSW